MFKEMWEINRQKLFSFNLERIKYMTMPPWKVAVKHNEQTNVDLLPSIRARLSLSTNTKTSILVHRRENRIYTEEINDRC